MAKKRVCDLAKELGKTSREVVKLLRELGFDKVKSAQSPLDDADLLQIQARLEAYGIIAMPKEEPAPPAEASPAPKTKPKKKEAAPAAEEPPAEAPAEEAPQPEPVPVAETAVETAAEEAAPEAPVEAPQPEAPEAPTPEPESELAPVEIEAEEEGAPAAREPAVEESLVEEPAPAEASAEEPAEEPLPAEVTAEAQEERAEEGEPPAGEGEAKEEKKPAKRTRRPKRREATILGKIDLSQAVLADAQKRSRPLSEIEADRKLKERALQNIRSRSARPPAGAKGTSVSTPSSGPGRGRRPHGQATGGGQAGGWGGGAFRRRGGGRKVLTRKKSAMPVSSIDPGKPVTVSMPISVKDLSQALGIKVSDLLRVLMLDLKVSAQINSYLEQHVVELVAESLERTVIFKEEKDTEETLLDEFTGEEESNPENVQERPPIITILGHVDHGKTSLLDKIREANVAGSEAGGITQHIGAYRITTSRGHEIVVIDTPGHEAFTQMRARGAQVTDIAVLVVAADDGVMPTTEEAISHIKAAEVPMVVALNKIDKADANPMRALQQLAGMGYNPEEWGGDTGVVHTSAISGQGIEDLVERVVLEADMLELHGDPTLPARGTVLEAKQTPEEGSVVTFLVENGTLHKGDNVLCGQAVGRIRIIKDHLGNLLEQAGPATPVQIAGLTELPEVGEKFYAVQDLKKGREVADKRRDQEREKRLAEKSTVSLANLSEQLRLKKMDELKVVLKVDVKGSLEPLRDSITQIKHEEVKVNVLHAGVGAVTEADVDLAEASGAIIIAFNVHADEMARVKAEDRSIQILNFDVIYGVIDMVKAAVEGRLKPVEKEVVHGRAEVRAIFTFQKKSIAGCLITDGKASRNSLVKVKRGKEEVHKGRLASLRREKDDVREVKAGLECGLMLAGFDAVKEGDTLEFYEIQYEKRTL